MNVSMISCKPRVGSVVILTVPLIVFTESCRLLRVNESKGFAVVLA